MHKSMIFCDHCGVEIIPKLDSFADVTMKFSEWDRCVQPRSYELCANCRAELQRFLECNPAHSLRTPLPEEADDVAVESKPSEAEETPEVPFVITDMDTVGEMEKRHATFLDMNAKYDGRLVMTFDIGTRPYALVRIYRFGPQEDEFALVDLSTNTGTTSYILSYNTSIMYKWTKTDESEIVRTEYSALRHITAFINDKTRIPFNDRDYVINIVRRAIQEKGRANRIWEIGNIKV